ncbi:sensor histidine kinase [Mucilaginibacter litoreus]|uniref:histidine kinase n=1 Tax=Mucilaginibacter litoreus TaxID=1048221 RepID=A0ABW3AVH5_9SPHI
MLKYLIYRLKPLKAYLIGNTDDFSFESRIFHSFSVFVLLTLLAEFIFNTYIGLYVSAGLTLAAICLQLLFYYLARFKGKLNWAITFSAIEINIITGIGYFFNAGLTGSTLLLFAASFFMIISVVNKKQWLLWLIVNLLLVCGVVAYEYYYPETIKQHYNSRNERFADNMMSYFACIALLYMGTATIRNSYMRQKQLTDEKNLALELLNAEKIKLFSIISHDMRTPLAAVQQYFKVLTELDMTDRERFEIEKSLMQSISSTQDMLSNLLKWAKNQMDGSIVHLRPVPLAQHLNTTSEVFTAIAAKKDISLTTFIANDDTVIKADSDMLQLVIRNLLNNAVKFTPRGGQIELKATITGTECVISVADNGTGIPLSMQAGLFTLNSATARGTENEYGTGLGLVLCKDYTELQGGRIWFTSLEGKGTTFYVSLPVIY